MASYSILVPAFVPDNLTLRNVFVATGADGTQRVTLLYTLPNVARSPELVVSLVDGNQPLNVPSGAREPRPVNVRGRTGYSWYVPSASAGHRELRWQEGPLTISVLLGGDWSGPSEDPHATDPLAVQIAESLRPMRTPPAPSPP